jgi:hypothetical protein
VSAGASRASWPAGGPAAGYGRVLVNGALSVKALFAGQLFRLHRQSAGVLRLSVPGSLARRPLRGPRHAGPLEQRAPGPESKHAASAITAASAPAGSAGSGRKLSRRPRRVGNDRHIRPTPAAASQRCPRLGALQAPMASRTREPASESSCSVFARGSPGNLLDSGQEVTLVPLTPITAVARYWAAMGIVPPPGQDQVPRLQAFRAEHPDIKIASPGRLARAHVGRLTRAARSWWSDSACASCPAALTSCSRPVRRPRPERPRSRSGMAGASRMP